MALFEDRLALHTWTLDTTPLPEVLRVIKTTGWNAVELRWLDFVRCGEQGMSNAQVLDLVRASAVPVGLVGTEYGLIFSHGAERDRLLASLDRACANAVALGCEVIMIASGQNDGPLELAAENFRAGGEVVQRHGVRLALEFNSAHPSLNRLRVARDLVAAANHPGCGLLLDAYHLERSGDGGRGFADLPPEQIFAFQFSDVPAGPQAAARRPTDRLPPGRGIVRWREVFQLLAEKRYSGYLSYEAPNPAQWARPAEEVAREARTATLAHLR
jgi:2-keto-myo-inositol isomerase